MKNCFQNLAFRWCERRYGVAPGAAPDDACKAIVLKNLDEISAARLCEIHSGGRAVQGECSLPIARKHLVSTLEPVLVMP